MWSGGPPCRRSSITKDASSFDDECGIEAIGPDDVFGCRSAHKAGDGIGIGQGCWGRERDRDERGSDHGCLDEEVAESAHGAFLSLRLDVMAREGRFAMPG